MQPRPIALVLLYGWLAVGCTTPEGEIALQDPLASLVQDAKEAQLSEDSRTLEFLSDGEVTLDEYRMGFADEMKCLESHGVVVTNQYVNKYDGWRLMADVDYEESKKDSEMDVDATATCGVNHTMYLELALDLTQPDRVDPRLLDHAQECLEDLGEPLTGTEESMNDLRQSTGTSQGVSDCLWVSLQEIYPGESAVETR